MGRFPGGISRRQSCSAHEAHVECVDVGALSADVLRFQHEADIAQTAATGFRISKSVLYDPFVNRVRLYGSVCHATGECKGLS
jgi:hypothetical protein